MCMWGSVSGDSVIPVALSVRENLIWLSWEFCAVSSWLRIQDSPMVLRTAWLPSVWVCADRSWMQGISFEFEHFLFIVFCNLETHGCYLFRHLELLTEIRVIVPFFGTDDSRTGGSLWRSLRGCWGHANVHGSLPILSRGSVSLRSWFG